MLGRPTLDHRSRAGHAAGRALNTIGVEQGQSVAHTPSSGGGGDRRGRQRSLRRSYGRIYRIYSFRAHKGGEDARLGRRGMWPSLSPITAESRSSTTLLTTKTAALPHRPAASHRRFFARVWWPRRATGTRQHARTISPSLSISAGRNRSSSTRLRLIPVVDESDEGNNSAIDRTNCLRRDSSHPRPNRLSPTGCHSAKHIEQIALRSATTWPPAGSAQINTQIAALIQYRVQDADPRVAVHLAAIIDDD